jgi:cytochrome c2
MKQLLLMLGALLLVSCAGGAGASQQETATAAAVVSAEHGRALFLDKGCVTCHVNSRVAGNTVVPVGPELTTYTRDAEFLRRWLADPPAVKPGTQMPNLQLSAAEIEDLIAFINAPRQ